ncbi:MAG: aminotransferase class I/II-fold pyridoxal phosphate-dependent enzyme, partial [Fulvivirga sp.]|nr:aminotransferase class I/II-fold pyridoxal phosphate-dependent enzyme [Fulvivirga sp.]
MKYKVPFIDMNVIHQPVEQQLNQVVQKVIDEGWYIGGNAVNQFEQDFAEYIGVGHCLSCGNGTDALELILKAYKIGPGDEVIIPSFTWVSDAEAVVAVGAKPVFAEVDHDTLN